MNKKYLVALDQGTTSSRCIIFDKNGDVVSKAQKEFAQIFPQAGLVEHNPMEIWSSQLSVMSEALAGARLTHKDIAGVGITNQRETVIMWNKETGEPIYNAIVWQCRRTSGYCDSLKASGFGEIIREKTGLVADAYFSGTKIKWILDNVAGARALAEQGKLLFGTVDTWLLWNLTKGKVHATDYSNASRTMLFNIHTLEWDAEILKELGIPASILPDVKPSSYHFGDIATEYFGDKIPIGGIAGDQQAALFGQTCFNKGSVKNTYGTGCFMLMNTGEEAVFSKHGLLTTIAWGLDGKICYALEGSVFIAGAALQWLRDGLRMIDKAEHSENYAVRVENTEGVYFVPAFVGLGAPYWNQHARGAFIGLTRGTEKEHFIRAVLESIAYQSHDVIKAMEADANVDLKQIRVDGGASANNFLMQFQADILNAEVIRPKAIESTALGAAYLAGLACGVFASIDEIQEVTQTDQSFFPKMEKAAREGLLSGWNEAVRRTF